jgi:hypothetical protein
LPKFHFPAHVIAFRASECVLACSLIQGTLKGLVTDVYTCGGFSLRQIGFILVAFDFCAWFYNNITILRCLSIRGLINSSTDDVRQLEVQARANQHESSSYIFLVSACRCHDRHHGYYLQVQGTGKTSLNFLMLKYADDYHKC